MFMEVIRLSSLLNLGMIIKVLHFFGETFAPRLFKQGFFKYYKFSRIVTSRNLDVMSIFYI